MAKAKKTMKNPAHPGEVIRVGVLEPLELSIAKAADLLGVRRATLSDVVNGKASLSAEMAVKIEKAFGPKAEHLLEVQCAYDIAQARLKAAADVAKVKRYRRAA